MPDNSTTIERRIQRQLDLLERPDLSDEERKAIETKIDRLRNMQ